MVGHATCKKIQVRNSWMKSLTWTPESRWARVSVIIIGRGVCI